MKVENKAKANNGRPVFGIWLSPLNIHMSLRQPVGKKVSIQAVLHIIGDEGDFRIKRLLNFHSMVHELIKARPISIQ